MPMKKSMAADLGAAARQAMPGPRIAISGCNESPAICAALPRPATRNGDYQPLLELYVATWAVNGCVL